MESAFFFETTEIPDNTTIFDEFEEQKIFFSYFLADEKYYLFLYVQKFIDLDFLYKSVNLVQELNSRKRQIRSLRGFLLYALEIMKAGKEYEILSTNLEPFFWKKVEIIIGQNKKGALHDFLFGRQKLDSTIPSNIDIEIKLKTLEGKIESLQERVIDLENQRSKKYAISGLLKGPELTKDTKEGDSSLEVKKDDSKLSDETKGNSLEKLDSNMLSDEDKRLVNDSFQSQRYNVPLNQKSVQNEPNFKVLGKISEEEKREIIQRGFQLQADGKISLKNYYEGVREGESLFQLKGYRIKYESIRRTKLYKNLKE